MNQLFGVCNRFFGAPVPAEQIAVYQGVAFVSQARKKLTSSVMLKPEARIFPDEMCSVAENEHQKTVRPIRKMNHIQIFKNHCMKTFSLL